MPSTTLSTALSLNQPLLLDGALATYLESLGADISGALWSASLLLENPTLIKRTHLDYFRAGANIAITASYQASIPGLVKHLGLSEEHAKDVVRKSVQLAQEARDEYINETTAQRHSEETGAHETSLAKSSTSVYNNLFIAGSVGPYGAFLADGSEYRGDYTLSPSAMASFHRPRIAALVDAGVDVLACETIPCKPEAEALLSLLTTEFPHTEAWFSFTLRDSAHIADGTPLSELAALFDDVEQVVALGVNCVPDDMALGALMVLQSLTKKALVVYPNSGEQWNAAAREWEGARTEGVSLKEKTKEWWGAGARLVGGCCRTTPEDIRVMREAVEGCEAKRGTGES